MLYGGGIVGTFYCHTVLCYSIVWCEELSAFYGGGKIGTFLFQFVICYSIGWCADLFYRTMRVRLAVVKHDYSNKKKRATKRQSSGLFQVVNGSAKFSTFYGGGNVGTFRGHFVICYSIGWCAIQLFFIAILYCANRLAGAHTCLIVHEDWDSMKFVTFYGGGQVISYFYSMVYTIINNMYTW